MRIIPKFLNPWGPLPGNDYFDYWESKLPAQSQPLYQDSDVGPRLNSTNWFENLFSNSKSVLNLGADASNNKLFNGRFTGNTLDQAYFRNRNYARSGQVNKEGDIQNWFNQTPMLRASNIQELTEAYNKDVSSLWELLKNPWNYNNKNASSYNRTHRKLYASANQDGNGDSDGYNIGWDENQVSIAGSATQSRRPIVYETTFEDDLKNNPDSARDRVSKINYNGILGYVYTDNLGYIRPLTDELKQILKLDNDSIAKKQVGTERKVEESIKSIKSARSDVDGEDPGDKERILAGLRGRINGGGIFNPLLLGALRVAIDNHANMKNTEEYNSHLRPPLLTPWQAHKVVYGDYIAKRLGELQSARFLSMASRPMTSDASLQLAGLLEAVEKGAQQVLAGQQRDAAQYYRTRDDALNLAILNIQVRTQVANTNRLLMSQVEQMKAQNIFNAKTLNMLNWDRWASQWEDRALAKYDYDQKRKNDLLEAFDQSLILYGIDDSAYRAAFKEYEATYGTDVNGLKKIIDDPLSTPLDKKLALNAIDRYNRALENMQKEVKALQVAKLRAQGNYIGYDWNRLPESTRKAIGLKNGGILRKLQQGGGFPLVQWTPNMGGTYQLYLSLLMSSGNAGTSSKSSKTSKSSDSDKEETTLLKNIVETLKGADLLSSDMDILSGLLKEFFDIQRYAPEGLSVDHLYRGYVDALANVNRAKLSANNFKQAYDNTLKNGGLHEAAIDPQGMVYVGVIGTGEMKAITPTEYLENKDSLRLLTNEDLLYLRLTLPKYAFNDKVLTSVVSNGIGMEEVGKFVKLFVGKLGNNKESRDLMVYTFGLQATQGIQVLQDLVKNGFTDELTAAIMAGGVDGLWLLNTMTENQIQLAKLAQSAVLQSLPKNMLSLLVLRAGGTKQAEGLVGKIILSGTSTESAFDVKDVTALDENGNLKYSTKTGQGGSGSSGEESTDRFLEDVQKGWGASDGVITINPGNQLELIIPSKDYNPIETASPSSLRDALVNSTLWGIGKDNNTKIYFGDQKIPVDKLGDVVYMGEGFSRIILPINSDGSPRFAVFGEVQKILNDLNINLNDLYEGNVPADKVKKFAETLNSKGLRDLVDGSKPDLTKFGVFMVTRGLATPKAGISDQNRFAVWQKDIDRDWYEGILSTKGLDGKVLLYETDRPNFWNPAEWDIFGASYDKIYEGTIYIPIALNPEMAAVAGGNKEKPSTAKNREKENQAWKNIQRYSSTPSTDVLQQ